MLGNAAQYVGNAVSYTRSLPTPGFNLQGVKNKEIEVVSIKNDECMKLKGKSHCLSAKDPTIVPNNMEDPKPAMKSCPISPFPYPY